MKRIKILFHKRSIAISYIFMVFALLIIYSPVLVGELWLKWDVYDAAFPLSVSISDSLKHGELPLWEPFSLRGVPLSHLIGVSVWSPITIILGALGFTQYMMQIQYIILILLAASFMYLSIKSMINNPWLAMTGGLAYATCGQFVSNAQHLTFLLPMVVFPLLHFSYRKWVEVQNFKWSILIGISFGLLILNNYPPFLFVSALFILIEYIFDMKRLYSVKGTVLKTLSVHTIHVFLAFVICSLVGLVGIYTTLEVVNYITRGSLSWDLATGSSLSYWYWFGAVTPSLTQIIHASRFDINLSMTNVYIAFPVLLLSLSRIPKKKDEWKIVVLIIVAVLLVMGKYTPFYRLLYELIPSLSSFRFPAGFRYLYFYYITIFAMYNFYKLNKEYNHLLKKLANVSCYLFIFIFGFLCLVNILKIQTVMIPRYTVLELALSIIALLIVVYVINFKRTSLLIVCLATIFFSYLGIVRNQSFTIGTYDRPVSYNNEIQTLYTGEKEVEIDNRYIEPSPVTMSHTIFTREFQTGGYVGSFELQNFSKSAINNGLPGPGDPVIFFVDNDSFKMNSSESKPEIIPESIVYSPNKFQVELNSEQSGFVILQQSYFKGWQVSVNGKKDNIMVLDDGTMGVKVDRGINDISFAFKPKGTILTAWISIITWILLILYGVINVSSKFIKPRLARR
ncbi:YfhO family protein [Paenibacillus sp. JSM ZJ436]|uniref:YfhO family protein n=1 Tax=Paenibacillus sp. JSM ZJ436 TaxID=3376190 RepID=UPI0037BC3973